MSDAAGSAASQTNQGTGNGAGSGTIEKPTWIEQLPEAMRSDETLYGHKTIGDLVTAFKTTAAERDNRIQVPGDQATDEERAAFFAKIGRPEKPDGYKLIRPDGIPDSLFNPAMQAKYAEVFHKLGIPASAAEAIWGEYYKDVMTGHQAQAKAHEQMTQEALNSLRDDWKNDFDKNTEVAIRAFKVFGKDNEHILNEKIGNVRLGDHPAFLKLFHAIGTAMSNDTAIFPRQPGQGGELSEEQKAAKMFPSMAGKG